MKKYHLFDMWGASTRITLCGRKLVDPWTVDHKGMHKNVCGSCQRVARLRGSNPRKYSPIEERKGRTDAGHEGVQP